MSTDNQDHSACIKQQLFNFVKQEITLYNITALQNFKHLRKQMTEVSF
jgi:hypothetical protein